MEPNQDKKQIAKDLYVHTKKTHAEIADILDINRKTVGQWAKSGRWEQFRNAFRMTPEVVMHNFWGYIDKVDQSIRRRDPEDQCPTMEEVNKLNKLVRTANLININHVGWYMQAYEELVRYLHQTDLPLAKSVVTASDTYIKGLLGRTNDDVLEFVAKKHITYVRQNLEEVDNNDLPEQEPTENQTPSEPNNEEVENQNAGSTIPKEETKEEKASSYPLDQITGSDILKDEIKNLNLGVDGTFSPGYEASNVTFEIPDIYLPKPTPANTHEEPDNISNVPNTPQNIFPENATFPATMSPAELLPPTEPKGEVNPLSTSGVPDKARAQLRGEASLSLPLSFSSSYYASLSPSERPSPFREGDILWINHLDDIDDDKRKMGDSIRYYPGMDPNEKNNQRAYEMRIQLEEKDRQEKEKAAAIRKEEMDKLMNMEIYYGYRDILKFMTSDIFAKVNIKGTEVNKMWFQYNLSQMERSEENRLLMTEAEFLRWHVTEAALKYMRRDG
jgi:hypothetical protein